MAPPKRALFSLNYESDVQHFDQHVSRPTEDDEQDGIKVFETKGNNEVSKIVRPFEKTVNRAVNEVIKDTGKKVGRVDGDLHYTSETKSSSSGTRTTSSNTHSNLSIHNKSARRALERKYDTSDL
ncbi:hypothetical protein BKA63DRAFT_179660 [Paraphoma chrysanthemicola]|nr:hypothetical protein BKA63DRAFT_179660 [Paraphoma chrysanthemicola]